MMDYFSKKYDQSYTEYNGTSIIFVSIITIVTAGVVYYTYIIKDLKDLRENWQDEKCKVQNIPFAGIINPPTDGTSFMEYTANNLSGCFSVDFWLVDEYSSHQGLPLWDPRGI